VATATEMAMATITTIKLHSTKRDSKRNGGDGNGNGNGDGDGDGDGDDNSKCDSGRRLGRWRQHGNRGDGDGHGGDDCRFF